MINLPILNISNNRRDLYLFTRNESGVQDIQKVSDFFPFYFEKTSLKTTTYSYDSVPLRKVIVSEPKEITKSKSANSYSSDIKFPVNYLIHKVDSITKTNIKYCFLDIEVLCSDIPEENSALYPISCITVFNSFSKETKTWYLGDYTKDSIYNEDKMLEDFVAYIHKERPDLILCWNSAFDYNYLYRRIKDFAKKISPINMQRLGVEEDIYYPAGISIIDYLKWFKKVFMREGSYQLEYIAQKRLGRPKKYSNKDVDFSKLNDTIKLRNVDDVSIMCELEEKYQIIPYFDEIRRLCKCQFEDLIFNSRIIEMLLFTEAKKQNIILPNKPKQDDVEEGTFEGAARDLSAPGLYENVGEFDLASAYPQMIVNFCLDSRNIKETKEENCIEINGVYFKQDQNALLPLVIKPLLISKDKLKKEVKENPNDKTLAIKYDAIKGMVNSAFGICGLPYFRLFNLHVASSITFLVRDLLMYVKEKIELDGLRVIYYDTDALMITTKENIVDRLNQYVKDWALEKYGKNDITLIFDWKGYFDKLFLLSTCHYYGILHGKKEPILKGIEGKRSSSSKYEAYFQLELLNKIVNDGNNIEVEKWVQGEVERIKTLPLEEVAFPCKIANKVYVNVPVFKRALDTTQKINKKFKVSKGEQFFYIYMQNKEVLAFTSEDKDFIDRSKIDWNFMIERSIFTKALKIFNAMKWTLQKNILQGELF